MKKSFILSLLLALCCSLQCWAEFNPTLGKMYALKEKSSGLYLDIQTLGINEANANATTNNLSLNVRPCIIYFEKGTTDNTKWTLKNVNNTYAMQASSRNWNATIGETAYEWTIAEPETGVFTIARADGKFINIDTKAAGQPIFCDKTSGMTFSLVEYATLNSNYCVLKSPTGTYLSLTTGSATAASFQETPTEFYITHSANAFYLESKSEAGKYVGSTHSWNTTTDFSLWNISEPDEEGTVLISRNNATGNINLGHDGNTNSGTGIFTNVGSGCFRWQILESIDCPTAAIAQGSKYHFTSNKILYTAPCNTIRFTLTESGAFYQNGAKRLSFDSFTLYDANDKEVELKESDFSGNNSKSYAAMLDGTDNTYTAGAWGTSGATDDYFEIALPNDIDLGGAFSFAFVTENTTMNAKAFRIDARYEKRESVKYTFAVNVPDGEEQPEITYDGEAVTTGAEFDSDFDAALFTATEIPGYTWKVVVNEEDATVTLVYTSVEIIDNPAAVVALANRIGGEGAADKFKFVLDPSLNSKQEVFVLDAEDEKISIKGTTISAITTGLGWYLNHIAKINIAWNSLNEKTVSGAAYADLSNLPLPATEETHASDAKYRYYLNTCTFGYSMTSWTWKRWQQEIDWMALHGINMPLQLVGMEEVWRKFLTMEEGGKRKYGYTDAEAKAFVAGPAFIAWWAMNNLEGWGGTAPGTKSGGTWEGAGGVQDDAWYVRQKNLSNSIVTRQRELGMQPVLPGWSGMVPTNFAAKSGYATRGNGGNWAGDFVRPLLLNVSNANYAEIAADYYVCLKEVMGESQYYSMDPFHEGGGAGTAEDYQALYAAMETAKPNSQWVIQQWQWSPTQKLSLTNVPEGRLIVLDLFSDGSPAFDGYNGYAPQEAVFCAIPNFGGRSGLMGRLNNLTDNYFKFKGKYASIKGIGAAPEAIEQTPVTYDLIFQLPWMNGEKPDVKEWVANYAVARYGQDNEEVKAAWDLLRQGPLNYGADGIQGPVEDVWAARPNLNANPASAWGKTINAAGGTYTKERRQMLIDATYKLLNQQDELNLIEGSVYESNYNYDLVEFGGAVMADYAYDLLKGINTAKGNEGTNGETYKTRRDAFLALIADVDKFKGTNLNFRLGKWTQEARDAAKEVNGATSATPDWYEYNNARTIVSTWSSPNTNLNDYSYRSWQGLMKDLYLPRWEHYFNNNCNSAQYGFFEWNWAHGMTHAVGQTAVSTTHLTKGEVGHTDSYTREPEGNTVELATALLGKYIIPVTVNGRTHYAYRYLDNDVSSMATIPVAAGGTVDLTPYFGTLTGLSSITSDVVNGDITALSKVAIKADAADGAHSATITLNDGTKLTFYFSINPAFSGVYTINYKNGDADAAVFVGYNEDKDNANNVGYKLIAKGTYSADALADKYFTIAPSGSGFTLSAQGKYLKSPNLSGWNHLMFSDNAAEAGAYIFEETGADTGIFKMRSTGSGINYVNDYDKLVFGNDKSDKENLSTFTLKKAETFLFTVSAAGMATLCLPFNVEMPDGMEAYDFAVSNISQSSEEGVYDCSMQVVAAGGEVLKSGTPVIVKANEGSYDLPIRFDANAAVKTSLPGSLLRGNFVAQDLVQNDAVVKFIFANPANGVGFYRMDNDGGTIAANKCWMEWNVQTLPTNMKALRIRFDQTTDIDGVPTVTPESSAIYDLAGRKLTTPQRGFNIVNGKKVIIK